MDQRTRVVLPFALLTAILAVSTSSIFIRFAQHDAPSLVIAALRLSCAALLLAPLVWMRHREELLNLTRKEILLGVISGLFLAAHFGTWISSLEYTTVASSVVFVSTGPLWVAILSPILLDERLRQIDPEDPVRFDFALSRLGILGLLRDPRGRFGRREIARVLAAEGAA